MTFKIGFLGYGRMARAISEGLAAGGFIPYQNQLISGRNRAALDAAAGARGVSVAENNVDLARRSEVIVLGVKPNQIAGVLEEIGPEAEGRLIISLAAGISLTDMNRYLSSQAGLVRSMPNVAALVGRGTTLICAAPNLPPEQLNLARQIFESVGLCLELDEKHFDAAGAVSGSGPAYFFTIMESMVRGAARLGLPWETARELVVSTILGSAEMAARQQDAPLSSLRDMVTSPGGTTAEALYVFERGGLGGLIQEALEAATQKSRRLS